MKFDHHLGITDTIVIIMSLLVPSAIGIFFRFSSGRQKTMDEYFFAERSASKLPVVMSLTASLLSSTLILGTSAEVYRFGPTICTLLVPLALGFVTSCYVFVPVYYQCEVSSVYEYLEMRFGRLTRCAISFMYCMQMMLFTSCVLYGPALVLNSVSSISVELAIILCGGICTFYCFLGGLKAVLWTDVFQQILLSVCILAIVFTGLQEVGLGEFYNRALAGGRLNFFNFSFDLTERYTTWNVFIRNFSVGIGLYGTNQIYVQRFLSMGQLNLAQSALLWSIISIIGCCFVAFSIGIILYAVFYLCDPVLSGQTFITRNEQIAPYFIITRLHSIPGLTGFCIAGIFSGALSTVSSAQNALAMTTVVDFVQPYISSNMTEKRLLLIGKALATVYGVLFISFSLAVSKLDSLMAAGFLLIAVFEGPTVAIFVIGVLTRKASDKVIVTSLILGTLISGWIGFNVLFSGYRGSPLPMEISGCLNSNVSVIMSNSLNKSCTAVDSCQQKNVQNTYESEIFFLYKISSFWIRFIGIFTTTCIAFTGILITGWNRNQIPVDSKCLSPVTRYWFKQEECINTTVRDVDNKVKEDED